MNIALKRKLKVKKTHAGQWLPRRHSSPILRLMKRRNDCKTGLKMFISWAKGREKPRQSRITMFTFFFHLKRQRKEKKANSQTKSAATTTITTAKNKQTNENKQQQKEEEKSRYAVSRCAVTRFTNNPKFCLLACCLYRKY